MAVLYINKVHGAPELDLKLDISGNSVTLALYSANDYGGNFGYPNGINYDISAGESGFSINTGSFSYSTSGQVIKTVSGIIGTGTLEVRVTCLNEYLLEFLIPSGLYRFLLLLHYFRCSS